MLRTITRSTLRWGFLGVCFFVCHTCFAQFQYFGIDAQFVVTTRGLTQVAPSISWVNQINEHHGFGVEVSLPFVMNPDLRASVTIDSSGPYDVGLVWQRKGFPTIGGRYRYFAGNHFFVGASLQLGLVRERFFADRNYAETATQSPINPVYLDYHLASPFVRLNAEAGLLWNMGGRLYGTLQGRVGMQATHARVTELGSFSTRATGSQTFESYHGIDLLGGALLGLGLKI